MADAKQSAENAARLIAEKQLDNLLKTVGTLQDVGFHKFDKQIQRAASKLM